jgi:hypothetical protein
LNSKFENNVAPNFQVVDIPDGYVFANNFSQHFEKICKPLNTALNAELQACYL